VSQPEPDGSASDARQSSVQRGQSRDVLIYAALGGVFFFLIIGLQLVAGFSPVLAGSALLPATFIMLVLAPRAGTLSTRIGPRLPMALGPIVAAMGVLLLLRIGPGASFIADVVPGVTVLGLGLALLVAPLTTTVLAAAEAEHAGVASGINNAVARAARLLAVAVLPLLVGISGDDYENPQAFAAGFHIALVVSALLLAGGITAALLIRNPPPDRARTSPLQPAVGRERGVTVGR